MFVHMFEYLTRVVFFKNHSIVNVTLSCNLAHYYQFFSVRFCLERAIKWVITVKLQHTCYTVIYNIKK